MKLAPRTFVIQWDLHAWAGVITSLCLFVIFYCGLFALFHDEFTLWQAPPAHAKPPASFAALFDDLERRVHVPAGARFEISRSEHFATAWVVHPPTQLEKQLFLGQPSDYSRLADELYYMHFFYRVPHGIEFAGVMGVLLLVTLLSGILIHWKDLLRQAWQFRPQLRLRFSASDAHKVLGVFGLPYAAMVGWTGAALGLYVLLSAPFVQLVYRGNEDNFDRARGFVAVRAAPASESRMLPLADLVARAERIVHARWPALKPQRVRITAFDQPEALATVGFERRAFEIEKAVHLNAHTGALIELSGIDVAPATRVDRVLFDLHYAWFGGMWMKALYALLALGMCAVLLTGNVVWLERRDPLRQRAGNRLLERLTVGVSFGLVCASSVYFGANISLPARLPSRADVEFGIFLASWASSIAGACWLRQISARGWAVLLCGAAAVIFGAVVTHGLITRPHQLGALLFLSVLCATNAALARKLARRDPARESEASYEASEPDGVHLPGA